jgi:hypothetical protein
MVHHQLLTQSLVPLASAQVSAAGVALDVKHSCSRNQHWDTTKSLEIVSCLQSMVVLTFSSYLNDTSTSDNRQLYVDTSYAHAVDISKLA